MQFCVLELILSKKQKRITTACSMSRVHVSLASKLTVLDVGCPVD